MGFLSAHSWWPPTAEKTYWSALEVSLSPRSIGVSSGLPSRFRLMPAQRFPVEAGHIQLFARAVGDSNPDYIDDGSGKEVFAPPTFPMAAAQFDPESGLVPKPDEKWFGSAGGPGFSRGASTGLLHAEQIFDYHRPLKAGDVLTGTASDGREWVKQSRSGGILNFAERVVDYHDQDGEPVVTVTSVSVIPEPAPAATTEGEES